MLFHPVVLTVAATLASPAVPPVPSSETPVSARAILPAEPSWAAAPKGGDGNLFTLLDYFDTGEQLALRYFHGLDASSRAQFRLADLAPACVRVSCQSDGGRSIVFSTGVLVSGGRRVVTAGHGVGSVDDPKVQLSVVLSNGREIPARVASRSDAASADQDWAVLDLTGPLPDHLVSVPVGSERPGGLAFILGYPERVGLDADGRATSSLASEAVALNPLLFVARVPSSAGSELEPLAGAVPLSGASGSPVFDERGTLVGVLVAVGRMAYPDGLRHVYRVSLSGDFEAALKS